MMNRRSKNYWKHYNKDEIKQKYFEARKEGWSIGVSMRKAGISKDIARKLYKDDPDLSLDTFYEVKRIYSLRRIK